MRSLRRFFTRLLNSAARQAEDDRMREEIEEHLALLTADNIRAGLSPAEARRQALLTFGGVEATQEDYRAERRLLIVEHVVQDVRFGWRMLRKSPGFTAVAVVTLALAISANAVVFGLMDALVLRPLDVPEAETLWGTRYGVDTGFQSVSQLSRSQGPQPLFRWSGRLSIRVRRAGHGPGSNPRLGLWHDRELLRRAATPAASWTFLPQLR